jgi:hypothetical protein
VAEEETGHEWEHGDHPIVWKCSKCGQTVAQVERPPREKQFYSGGKQYGWVTCEETIAYKIMTS